jgi:hypothetical protein
MADVLIEAEPAPPVATDTSDPFDSALDDAMKKDLRATPDEPGGPTPAEPTPTPQDPTKPKDTPKPEKSHEPEKATALKLSVPEAKVEAPVPEEIPEDAPVPRHSAEWKKFRQANNERVALLKDREKKLAEFETKADQLKELDAIRAERDQLQARVKEATVLSDPALTKPFDEAVAKEVVIAKDRMDPEKHAAFEAISVMPPGKYRDAALREFFDGMEVWQQTAIANSLDRIDRAHSDRAASVQDARANADKIIAARQQESEQVKEAVRQRSEQAFSRVTDELKAVPGWQDLLGHAEAGPKIIAESRKIYSGDIRVESDLARYAIHAAVAPMLMQHAIDLTKQLTEMESTLGKVRAATPGLGSGTTATPKSDDFLNDVFQKAGMGGI